MKSEKLILLLVALGFLGLFVEIRYSHGGILAQTPSTYIPLAATALGFLAALAGMAAEKKLATICGVVMILVSLTGPGGIFFHTEGKFDRLGDTLKSNTRQERLARANGQYGGPFEERPLLAPLSITGLALIGAICLLGSKRS